MSLSSNIYTSKEQGNTTEVTKFFYLYVNICLVSPSTILQKCEERQWIGIIIHSIKETQFLYLVFWENICFWIRKFSSSLLYLIFPSPIVVCKDVLFFWWRPRGSASGGHVCRNSYSGKLSAHDNFVNGFCWDSANNRGPALQHATNV